MASRIYSTLFLEVVSQSANAGYLVADGDVAVVRDVAVLFIGSPSNSAVEVITSALSARIFYHEQTELDEYVHWEGRQVVPGGTTIRGISSGPNEVSLRVSGYLLTAT